MTATLDIAFATVRLVFDPSGAVWWPDERLLVVADLHLEKGSSFARRGTLLPPYDTRATLHQLNGAIARYRPARVVALGDSFHDREASARLDGTDLAELGRLVAAQDWIWIAGNHDPLPPVGVGGRVAHELQIGDALVLRHEAEPGLAGPEISGHYHPKASLRVHGRRVSCRCFVSDGRRLVLPAFGAFTGGLDVADPAFRPLFPDGFTAHLLGSSRLLAVRSEFLRVPDISGDWARDRAIAIR